MADKMSGNVSTNFSFPSNESSERCNLYGAANSTIDQVLMTTGYSILLFLSLAGNALVIAVFCKRYHQLRTPVNYFIVSMAVSDVLVPIFVIPRRIQDVYFGHGSWLVGGVLGDVLCKFLHFVDEVCMAVSSQSMVFIAAERCWAIVFPTRLPLIPRRTTPRFVCFTWLFSMAFFSYYFFVHKLIHNETSYICDYSLPQIFHNREDLWRADRISLLIVFVIIPFVLMAVFYSAIIVTLHRQKKIANHLSSKAQYRRSKKNQRITFMLVTVVALFFISWTPRYVYFFLQYYPLGPVLSCQSIQTIHLCGHYMNYIYTAVNPFIYYIFNTTYRQGFHELLCCLLSCLRGCRRGTDAANSIQQNVQCQDDNPNQEELEVQVITQNQS